MLGTVVGAVIALSSIGGAPSGEKGETPPDDIVAELTINSYYYDVWPYFGGHSFLTVKNVSGSSLFVGHVTLNNNSAITIGTWDSSVTGYHSGIYYGFERTSASGDWKNLDSNRMKYSLTDLEFPTLHSQLRTSSNNQWSLTNTCANFASRVWNACTATSYHITESSFPNDIYDELEEAFSGLSGYSTTSWLPYNSLVGYVNSSGNYVSI